MGGGGDMGQPNEKQNFLCYNCLFLRSCIFLMQYVMCFNETFPIVNICGFRCLVFMNVRCKG